MRLGRVCWCLLTCLVMCAEAAAQPEERCGTRFTNNQHIVPGDCGVCDTIPVNFQRFRPGVPNSQVNRDIEFLLDDYLVPSLNSDAQNTLLRFGQTAVTQVIGSPVATDARGFQLVHEYFKREGSTYDPNGSTPVLRLGLPIHFGTIPYADVDRGHADVYLHDPRRRQTTSPPNSPVVCRRIGGSYLAVACYRSPEEDVSSGRAADFDSVRYANSFSL